ncbi:hypothetical protein MTO96_038858 [Rhipicephalus appendiculatus]
MFLLPPATTVLTHPLASFLDYSSTTRFIAHIWQRTDYQHHNRQHQRRVRQKKKINSRGRCRREEEGPAMSTMSLLSTMAVVLYIVAVVVVGVWSSRKVLHIESPPEE